MPLSARHALDRVIVEHMDHGGTMNGELVVTYDDFVRDGVGSRSGTARAVRILVALGFLDVTRKGHRSYGGARVASAYALTWLPHRDGTPATNRWRRVRDHTEARKLVELASVSCPTDQRSFMMQAAAA